MRIFPLSLIIASLLFYTLPASALQITVQSPTKKIDGIGFTVHGKQYGGMGNKYHKSGMSKGDYNFGMRVHGKNVGCVDKDGKKMVKITGSSHVVLTLSKKHCTLTVNSK